ALRRVRRHDLAVPRCSVRHKGSQRVQRDHQGEAGRRLTFEWTRAGDVFRKEPNMRCVPAATVGVAIVLSLSACSRSGSGVDAAVKAMGAGSLNSITYSGSGTVFGFGQAYLPGERWPRFEQRSYVASINYQTPGMRLDTIRSQGEHPPHGGAAQ